MDLTPRTDFKGQDVREVPERNLAKKDAEWLAARVRWYFPAKAFSKAVEVFVRHDMEGAYGYRVQVGIHNDSWLFGSHAEFNAAKPDIMESALRHTGGKS